MNEMAGFNEQGVENMGIIFRKSMADLWKNTHYPAHC
jgi:hypothetical protein